MTHGLKRVAVALSWRNEGQTNGIAQYAYRTNWILRYVDLDPQEIRNSQPHGIICQFLNQETELLAAVQAAKVPVVGLHTMEPDITVPLVLPDAETAGKLAAEHLINCGFTHLAYVGRTSRDLFKSFDVVARDAGCSVTAVNPQDPHMRRVMGLPKLSGETGDDQAIRRRAWARRFFSGCRKPVGVFTSELLWAVDIIAGCSQVGVFVPEQVAVATMTSYPNEGGAYPVPLTSIAPDYERQGYEAAVLLDRMMNGEPVAANTVIKVSPHPLEVRDSTMCHATENLPVARASTFIMRNLHDRNLSAKQICLDQGVARSALYKDFHAHIKMPIARYIEQLRVDDAKKMLAKTKATADEIAIECGFGEVLRFRRAFKRVTGMTPGSYRRGHSRAPAVTARLDALPNEPKWSSKGPRQEARQEARQEPMELRILRVLDKGALGRRSLAIQLGHRKISGRLNKLIPMLLATHAIEPTIPRKLNSSLQQYRLTEKGRLLLREK